MSADDRVSVRFGDLAEAGPGDAILYDGHRGPIMPAAGAAMAQFVGLPGHNALKCQTFGCPCGTGRDPAAQALSGLFFARARGEVPHFERVIADVRDVALVRSMLEHDLFVRARFRLHPPPASEPVHSV